MKPKPTNLNARLNKKLTALDIIYTDVWYGKELVTHFLQPYIDLVDDELTAGHQIMGITTEDNEPKPLVKFAVKFQIEENAFLTKKELTEVVRWVLEAMHVTKVEMDDKIVLLDEIISLPDREDLEESELEEVVDGLEERIYLLWE